MSAVSGGAPATVEPTERGLQRALFALSEANSRVERLSRKVAAQKGADNEETRALRQELSTSKALIAATARALETFVRGSANANGGAPSGTSQSEEQRRKILLAQVGARFSEVAGETQRLAGLAQKALKRAEQTSAAPTPAQSPTPADARADSDATLDGATGTAASKAEAGGTNTPGPNTPSPNPSPTPKSSPTESSVNTGQKSQKSDRSDRSRADQGLLEAVEALGMDEELDTTAGTAAGPGVGLPRRPLDFDAAETQAAGGSGSVMQNQNQQPLLQDNGAGGPGGGAAATKQAHAPPASSQTQARLLELEFRHGLQLERNEELRGIARDVATVRSLFQELAIEVDTQGSTTLREMDRNFEVAEAQVGEALREIQVTERTIRSKTKVYVGLMIATVICFVLILCLVYQLVEGKT